MASPNVPFDQLTPEAKRKLRQQNPDAFPLRDNRPAKDIDRYRDDDSASKKIRTRKEISASSGTRTEIPMGLY